jgi:Ser/Thr protein kinase RdoA (MazF antagonist)
MPAVSSANATPTEQELVCRRFALGDPVGSWETVPGARSHALWSLITTQGRYAVKAFDPTVDHTRSPNWRQHLDEAVELELAAAQAGLPVPRPIPVAGTTTTMLADLPGTAGTVTVRVHEWVDGRPLPDDTTDPALAAGIGTTLAHLHALPVPCHHTKAIGLTHTQPDDHLIHLLQRARDGGHPWSSDLDRARDAYQTVRDLCDRRARWNWRLITTHRDLSPKNVLLAPEATPVIVDWDVAGPWTVQEETAAAAAEWAGALAHEPHRDAAHALVNSYRQANGQIEFPGPEVFAGWLVKHANWTEMHIRRALDDALPDHRRRTADQAVPGLLDQLQRFTAGAANWTRWLADA